jgi:hypothetical protein
VSGSSARIWREGEEKLEWTPEDFACYFLWWLAAEYPDCAGRNVSLADIEDDFFPRFQAATGCHDLQLGTVLRGLGVVTKKVERRYTDWTGRRCSITEYHVPDPAAAVVNLAEAKRERA